MPFDAMVVKNIRIKRLLGSLLQANFLLLMVCKVEDQHFLIITFGITDI
jgi:hypothetical protein